MQVRILGPFQLEDGGRQISVGGVRQRAVLADLVLPRDVPATRYVIDDAMVQQKLGYLCELPGTWEGRGFNLIARPDLHDKANLYLQLNQTHETLTITPIGSAIPNRGFGQDDIELFGLSYLQKIHDHPVSRRSARDQRRRLLGEADLKPDSRASLRPI